VVVLAVDIPDTTPTACERVDTTPDRPRSDWPAVHRAADLSGMHVCTTDSSCVVPPRTTIGS
jgi:hypothetical protein